MTDARTAAATAERLSRRRARMLWFQAFLFIIWQASFYTWGAPEAAPLRTVDQVKISAWAVWSLVLLVLLASGGGWFRGREVRRLLNDEGTRVNRAIAQQWGFWFAVLTAIVLFGVIQFETVSAMDALHIVLTFGIGAAILRLAVLERRAERLV